MNPALQIIIAFVVGLLLGGFAMLMWSIAFIYGGIPDKDTITFVSKMLRTLKDKEIQEQWLKDHMQ